MNINCKSEKDLLGLLESSTDTQVWESAARNHHLDLRCFEMLAETEQFFSELLQNPKTLKLEAQYPAELLEIFSTYFEQIQTIYLPENSQWWEYFFQHPNEKVVAAAKKNIYSPKKSELPSIEQERLPQKKSKPSIHLNFDFIKLNLDIIKGAALASLVAGALFAFTTPPQAIKMTAPIAASSAVVNYGVLYKKAEDELKAIEQDSRSAKTPADFQKLVMRLNGSIETLDTIPPSHGAYSDARLKITLYKNKQQIYLLQRN